MARTTRYTAAKANFTDAGADTAHRTKFVACPECGEQMLISETFRGTAYHVAAKCPNGHVTERYGYADKAVKD